MYNNLPSKTFSNAREGYVVMPIKVIVHENNYGSPVVAIVHETSIKDIEHSLFKGAILFKHEDLANACICRGELKISRILPAEFYHCFSDGARQDKDDKGA